MYYRKGVAIIITSIDRTKILLGERLKQPGQWQVPQGGIEIGEEPEQTLVRELFEEVGVKLPILNKTSKSISYDWPVGIFPHSELKGHSYIYFLLDGSNVDINELRASDEFSKFIWFSIKEAIEVFLTPI